MHDDSRPIALIGLMGAGKSAVARALATRLGGRAEDLDQRIEDGAGETVARLFEREGEAGFRAREKAALDAALAGHPAVIACGGGIVLDPDNRSTLRDRCRTVWIEIPPEVAARRVAAKPEERPLLGNGHIESRLAALLRARAPLYESVASIRVDGALPSPERVADTILASLAGAEEPR